MEVRSARHLSTAQTAWKLAFPTIGLAAGDGLCRWPEPTSLPKAFRSLVKRNLQSSVLQRSMAK